MDTSLNETSVPTNAVNPVLRWILGLFLLVPALYVCGIMQFSPTIDTIRMSTQKVALLSSQPSQFVGNANYQSLLSDPSFGQAILYTLTMIGVRLLIVAVVPPLIGLLVGSQRTQGRLFNRLFLVLMSVLISPVVLAVLWTLLTSQVWGKQPSPLLPLPEWMMLATPNGARTSVIVVDALITVGIAAAVGGAAFMAVMRGRSVSHSYGMAGIGVWLIGLFLTIASLPHTFEIPYIMTNGGPMASTTTLGLVIYNQGFMMMRMGVSAVPAVIAIITAIVMGFLVWAVITGFSLRLMFTPPARPAADAGLLSVFSTFILAILGLPLVGLIIWALWLAASNQGFESLTAALNLGKALINTISGPWMVIWLVQIPVTYLAGLSLGFLKPIHRIVSGGVFLAFLLFAFIPAEALMVSWFMIARDTATVNTLGATGFAWMFSGFALVIFKMFFEGAAEKYKAARASGQTISDAFVNTTLLPSLGIVALVGIVLSFASFQSFIWPLIVIQDQSLSGLPQQLMFLRGSQITNQGLIAGGAVALTGITALIFIPLLSLLNIFVLDRLSIVAGPPVDADLLFSKQKLKRDESIEN